MKKIRFWCLCGLVYPMALCAQPVSGSGAISGRVWDRGGEGIPDTTVEVSNDALGVKHVLNTNIDGMFEATGLPPGTGYRLQVTRQKFSSWERREIEIGAGQRLNFQITLYAESKARKKTAGDEAVEVDDATGGVVTTATARELEQLPVRERRWTDLALLAPVTTGSRAHGVPANHGEESSNSYLTDGIETANLYRPSEKSGTARLPMEAIAGFQTIASGASAEFGGALGGTVNAVTRGGGNGFHGSAYGSFSNSSLAATGRYTLGNNLFRNSNQGGWSLGGPIQRNKLFYFANMELLDSHREGLNRITNPVIANLDGDKVNTANCTATIAQCAAAATFIQSQMNVLAPQAEHWVSGLGRIDYRLSERNMFNIEANVIRARSPQASPYGSVAENGGLLGTGSTRRETQFGKFGWTSALGGSATNELRLGVFHDRIMDPASAASLSTGNVAISIAGVTVGQAHPDSSLVTEKRGQLADNFRFQINSHTITAGVDWSKRRNVIDELQYANGAYTYSSLTAFALDFAGGTQKNYTTYEQTFGNSWRDLHTTDFGAFVQDSWQFSRNLRLSAGVRWEKGFYTQPDYYNTTYYKTRTITSSNINADPRLSLAYTLDDRTVVRAGFGTYHSRMTGELLDALYLGNGAYQTNISVNSTQSSAPVFPNVISSVTKLPAGTMNLIYGGYKLRNPYTKQSSLAIERRLNSTTNLSISYLGVRGVKLLTANDTNLTAPTRTATYTIYNANGIKSDTFTTDVWTAKADVAYGHIYQVENGGANWYRALIVELNKRMSRSFDLHATYTWSHAIDDVGGTLVSGGVPLYSYNGVNGIDRGSSSTDQRHRAVFDLVWQPTPSQSTSGFTRYLVNGWEISTIATLASAQPQTALVVVNGQQFSGITFPYTGSMNGTGAWSRVPFYPVNSLYSEPSYTVNARFARTLPFTERIQGKLIFEAFNLLNMQYGTGVNVYAYTATGGIVRPLAGAGDLSSASAYVNGTTARSCQVAFRLTF